MANYSPLCLNRMMDCLDNKFDYLLEQIVANSTITEDYKFSELDKPAIIAQIANCKTFIFLI
jgi:hypothetical protein